MEIWILEKIRLWKYERIWLWQFRSIKENWLEWKYNNEPNICSNGKHKHQDRCWRNYAYHPSKKCGKSITNPTGDITTTTELIDYDAQHNPKTIIENDIEWHFE